MHLKKQCIAEKISYIALYPTSMTYKYMFSSYWNINATIPAPLPELDHLLGELLLTQFVEGEELPGQLDIINEATAGQLHPNDDLAVRDHHGYRAEVDLQVLWKLLTPCIAWVLIG